MHERQIRLLLIENCLDARQDSGSNIEKRLVRLHNRQIVIRHDRKRIQHLLKNPDTGWRVSGHDHWQSRHYEQCLADFDDYCTTHDRALADYKDTLKWNRMSLHNIAGAGYFAADRSIGEYADRIWKLKAVK